MKKHLFFLALVAALLLPTGLRAQGTLTVADGTDTTDRLPVYGYLMDYGFHTEFIYPSSMLEEMTGGNISMLTFYSSATSTIDWAKNGSTPTIQVWLEEVSASTTNTTSWTRTDASTLVYEGSLSVTNGQMVVEFDEPFPYTGGNLLMSFFETGGFQWKRAYFYGVTATGAGVGVQGTYSTYLTDVTATNNMSAVNMLPKVTFEYTPGGGAICRRPSTIQVSDITTDGASFTWTANNEETEWKVYVDGEFVTSVEETSYTATGLSSSSQHTFGVSAVCGSESESGIATKVFRTACADVTLPWGETFESYASGSGNRPDCWTTLQTYNSYPYIGTTAHGGSRSYQMYTYSSTQPNFVATPKIATSLNQLHVSFWAYVSSYGTPTFEAGVMADTADLTTFIPLVSFQGNSNTWTEYEFYTDTVSADVEGFVAFRWKNSSGYSAYIDDIVVEVASTCRRPESAQVVGGSQTYEGATVSWVDRGGAATSYTVRVATVNDPTNAQAVDNTFEASPAILTELNPNTTYHAWVASNCGDEQTSWRYAGSFTTERDCYPVTNLTIADKGITNAVVTWQLPADQGREATGVTLKVVDRSVTPADTVQTLEDISGTSYFLTDLEGGHSYTVLAYTQCGDYESYTYASAAFQTDACGRIEGTTTTSYSPFHGNYNYGYSQTIYTPSDLNGLNGDISGLQFRVGSVPSRLTSRSINVYIGTTELELLDTNNYVSVDELTQVVDEGSIDVSSTGWVTVNFSEPYSWDGSSNIVVAVQNITGGYSSFSWGAHAATAGNTVYWYRDGDTIDPADPNARYNNSLPNRGKSTTVPDITFIGDCEGAACAAPLVALGEIAENSLSLQWMAGANESSWTVEYRTLGAREWSTSDEETSETETTISGLEASTAYELRVGSLCGDDTLYSPVLQARTLCGQIELPFAESFEGWTGSNAFPACWTKMQASGNYPYLSTSYAHTGSASMYAYGSTVHTLIASPLVPTDDPTNLKVTFWTYGSSNARPNNGTMKVGVVTNTGDPATFQEIRAVATGITGNSWTEWEAYTDSITVADDADIYIAFQFNLNSSTSSAYLDDVNIGFAGNCRKPNTPSVSNVSYYNATLHWNDVNHGTTTYEVRYNTLNNPDTTGYLTATAEGDSIVLEGLHNGTRYYTWIRPSCDSEIEWLAFSAFTTQTSCFPVTDVTLDGTTLTTAAISWSYNQSTGMEPIGTVVTLKKASDSSIVVEDRYVEGSSTTFTGLEQGTVYIAYLATLCDPDSATAVQMTFATKTPSCGEVTGTENGSNGSVPFHRWYKYGYSQILYRANELSTLDVITGIGFAGTTDRTKTYTVDVYIGHTDLNKLTASSYVPYSDLTLVAQNVPFTPKSDYTVIPFTNSFEYDGVSNLVVVIDNNTGTYDGNGLYWKSHNADSSSVYHCSDSENLNPASFTTTLTATNYRPDIAFYGDCDVEALCYAPVLSLGEVTTSSVDLTWAADDSDATFEVQYKASSDSSWITATTTSETSYTVSDLTPASSYDFRVGIVCSDESMVYSDIRQTYTECDVLPLPHTFSFTQPLSPCWTLTGSSVYRNSTANALYWSSTGSNAIVPEVEGEATTLMARIRERYTRYSTYYTYDHNLVVGMCAADGSQLQWLDTVELTTTAEDYVFYFDSYTGTGNRIVLTKDGSDYIYVEEIEVSVDNGCRPVSGLTLSNVSASSAMLSWSHVSVTDFEVQYRLRNASEWESVTVSSNSTTLGDLTPSSSYVARVRALCGGDDNSMWSGEIAFTTSMIPAALPYSTGFEEGDDVAWQMDNGDNGWFIGAAAHAAGSERGLYISNTNGTTNAYTTSNAPSVSYASKLFAFDEGEYTLSYDWKCNGEGSNPRYDYLRVFVVPATTALVANDGSNYNTSSNKPDGSIYASEPMNLSTEWQSVTATVTGRRHRSCGHRRGGRER